jgi:hypothetical protein
VIAEGIVFLGDSNVIDFWLNGYKDERRNCHIYALVVVVVVGWLGNDLCKKWNGESLLPIPFSRYIQPALISLTRVLLKSGMPARVSTSGV